MVPIKPHAYAELPDEFHTCQMWQGFKNPLLVTQNVELKKELGFQDVETQKLLEIFNGSFKIKSLKPLSMVYSGHQFGQYVDFISTFVDLILVILNIFITTINQSMLKL